MPECSFLDKCSSFKKHQVSTFTFLVLECPEGPNIVAIVGGSLAAVALIGLLILLIVKVVLYASDLREWKRFEKDRKHEKSSVSLFSFTKPYSSYSVDLPRTVQCSCLTFYKADDVFFSFYRVPTRYSRMLQPQFKTQYFLEIREKTCLSCWTREAQRGCVLMNLRVRCMIIKIA